MNRLTEMESFVAVIETGGYTKAAQRLSLSKSAISKQISSLEHRLGARLFDRTTRNVVPTEIGSAYYQEAVRVLELAANADAMVIAQQSQPQGRLKISSPMDLGQVLIGPIMRNFVKAFPEVCVDLVFENRNVDLLSEKYDAAVRIGALSDSGLIGKKIGAFKMQFVAAPSYFDEMPWPREVKDLRAHHLLHFSSASNQARFHGFQKKEGPISLKGAKSVLTINDGSSLKDAALEGLGIAYLPDFIVGDALENQELVAVFPDMPPEIRPVHLLYQSGPYIQPKLRHLIDFLSSEFKSKS